MNIKDFFVKTKEQSFSLFYQVRTFIDNSKKKFKNLYKTNYDTGMYHLEHGHLWDATFRFRLIKRYWPNKLKAQYMYAYCLVLQKMNNEAEKVLATVLIKDPNYEDAINLLDDIESDRTEKIISDYNNKISKLSKAEIKNIEGNEEEE